MNVWYQLKVVPGVPRAADDKPEDITIKYLFEVVLGQLVLILGKRQYGIYFILHQGNLWQLVVIWEKWPCNTYFILYQEYLGQLVMNLGKWPYKLGTIKKGRPHGGGWSRNLKILRTNSTDRLREMRTRGREGVQNPENITDVLHEWSLTYFRLH